MTPKLLRTACLGVSLIASLSSGCGIADGRAGTVLGQADLTTNLPNNAALPPDARLKNPTSISAAIFTRFYVADFSNSRVLSWPNAQSFNSGDPADIILGQQKIDSILPNEGGPPTPRSLSFPRAVATLGDDVYVSDSGNNRVVRYKSPVGNHQAADQVYGTQGDGKLSEPAGLVVHIDFDGIGRFRPYVVVADMNNHRIIAYDIEFGFVKWVIGQRTLQGQLNNDGLGPGVPTATGLQLPIDVALSETYNGDLYVADYGNNRVLRFNAPLYNHQAADLVLGQQDFDHNNANQGFNSAASTTLNGPSSVAVDPGGNLYVSDSLNNRVLRYTTPLMSGTAASLIIGQPNFTQAQANNGGVTAKSLFHPFGLATDSSAALLVADSSNHRVLRYPYIHVAHDNLPDSSWTGDNQGLGRRTLRRAMGAAIDQSTGRLFVADLAAGRVVSWPNLAAIDRGDDPDTVIGAPTFDQTFAGTSEKTLNRPDAVAVDSAGNVWIADTNNHRVLRFPNTGSWNKVLGPAADRVIGQVDFTSNLPNHGGAVSASGLDQPSGIAVDQLDDTVYVADTGNHRVLQFGKNLIGNPPVVIGQFNPTSNAPNSGDAFPNERGFNHPRGLVEFEGGLYVADVGNERVLVVNLLQNPPMGIAVLGQKGYVDRKPNQGHGPDGTTLFLAFDLPGLFAGIAVDRAHDVLYVADAYNARVLQYRLNAATGQAANRVFGQQDPMGSGNSDYWLGGFVSSASGCPGVTGLAVDKVGNLIAIDSCRSLILKYDVPVQ